MRIFLLFVSFSLSSMAINETEWHSQIINFGNCRIHDVHTVESAVSARANPLEILLSRFPAQCWIGTDYVLEKYPNLFQKNLIDKNLMPFEQILLHLEDPRCLNPLEHFGRVVIHPSFLRFLFEKEKFSVIELINNNLCQAENIESFGVIFFLVNHKYLYEDLFPYFWEILDDYRSLENSLHEDAQNQSLIKKFEDTSKLLNLVMNVLGRVWGIQDNPDLFYDSLQPLITYNEQNIKLPTFVIDFLSSHPYTINLITYEKYGEQNRNDYKCKRTLRYDFLRVLNNFGILSGMLSKPIKDINNQPKFSGLLELVFSQFESELAHLLEGKRTDLGKKRDLLYHEHIPIIKMLLTAGADINVLTADGEILWHFFIEVEQKRDNSRPFARPWPWPILEPIISNCADIFARGESGKTIFNKIASAEFTGDKKNQYTKNHFFMKKIFDQWDRETPSHEFFAPLWADNTYNQRFYCLSFFNKYPEAITARLIEEIFFKPADSHFNSAMLYQLVERGREFNEDKNFFETLLFDHPEYVFKMMKESWIDEEWVKTDWVYPTLNSLSNQGFDLNRQDENGDTLLHIFARYISNPYRIKQIEEESDANLIGDVISVFLDLHVNLEIINHDNQTPTDIFPHLVTMIEQHHRRVLGNKSARTDNKIPPPKRTKRQNNDIL